MLLPFAPWRPDLPNLGAATTKALGCVPRTEESYGPFGILASSTGALGARCQGVGSFIDSSGNVSIFSADATKLYLLSTTTWNNVSKAGNYTFATDTTCLFAQHSTRTNDRIIQFGDINTNVQVYVLGSSALFADLAAAAPRARYGAIIYPGVLMLGNTWDATDGYRQNRVWWHDLVNNDPTNWPTPGGATAQAVQSDYRDLTLGGPIMGITGPCGGAVAGIVFSRKGIQRIIYSQGPSIFDFFALSDDLGVPSSNAIVKIRDWVYFLTDDGFYKTDGAQLIPIGAQKVDRYLWGRVDQNYLYRIYAAADPANKLVFFAAPDGSNSGGNPSFILAYNYELDRWSLPQDGINIELIRSAYAQGYTLDQLDSFGTLETLPYSLDSAAWQGGRPNLAGFDSSHKYGAFNSTNAAVTIDTQEVTGENGARSLVQGLRPNYDGGTGTITCGVGYRDTPNGALTYSTGTAEGADGFCPQRVNAKFVRGRFSVAAGHTLTQMKGLEPRMTGAGLR